MMSDKIKAVPKKPMNMAALLADMEREDTDIADVGELAPLSVAQSIPRSPRALPIANLAGLGKLLLMIGEGNAGKTVLARYVVDRLIKHDALDPAIIAALAPGNRNLSHFVTNVMQPPTTDPKATAEYAHKIMSAMAKERANGQFDFGGGDASMRYLIQAVPDLAQRMEDAGLALVPAYLLTPRAADLTFLKTYEAMGFKPRATALILNLARAETPRSFDGIRRQPEYKAAIARGAVELWMPAMPQEVALRIERAKVQFTQARDGDAPEGGKPANISLIERVMVREWLEAMDAEFSVVEGWMPWA